MKLALSTGTTGNAADVESIVTVRETGAASVTNRAEFKGVDAEVHHEEARTGPVRDVASPSLAGLLSNPR